MGAKATARHPRSGEHSKGRLRLPLLTLVALIGPPVFGLQVGLLSGLYSLIVIVYALWALRLTVVFRDDPGLGYLLCLFDVALTLPLVLWGSPTWLAAILVGGWVAGFAQSVSVRSREERAARDRRRSTRLVDPATGLRTSVCFRDAVAGLAAEPGSVFAVVIVRVQRFDEALVYFGREAAERAIGAVARRAAREAGKEVEAFRLASDLVALAVPVRGSLDASELAAATSKSVNRRLVEGRKIDSFVGYSVFPRDGATAEELVQAADASTSMGGVRRSPAIAAFRPSVSAAH